MGAGRRGNFGNTLGSGKVHDFPKIIHIGKQGKHLPGHNNYQKGKSIFYGSAKDAQRLINKYSGTGQWVGANKEVVDFKKVIGHSIDRKTGNLFETTWGTIHYSKTGAHIVPAKPKV